MSADSELAVIVPPRPSMALADMMTAELDALISPAATIDEIGLSRGLISWAPLMPPASSVTIA